MGLSQRRPDSVSGRSGSRGNQSLTGKGEANQPGRAKRACDGWIIETMHLQQARSGEQRSGVAKREGGQGYSGSGMSFSSWRGFGLFK